MQDGKDLVLRCFIEGRGDEWNAICIDLDLAAQGHSRAEVQALLGEMIDSYIERAAEAPPAQRAAMLSRQAPLLVRVNYVGRFLAATLFASRRPYDTEGSIVHRPCPA